MSEATQQENAVQVETPVFLPTKWAQVALYGWQNVSDKFANLIATALNVADFEEKDHNVRMINIGDLGLTFQDTKKPSLGESWVDGQACAVDLQNLWASSVRRTQEANPHHSVFAFYCCNVLVTILHEVYHLFTKGECKEDDAEHWAHQTLFKLAKEYEFEPDLFTNEPFFRDAMLGGDFGEDVDDEWLANQKDMAEDRLFFHRPESDGHVALKLHTFKQYLKYLDVAEADDDTWMGEGIPVPPIAQAVLETTEHEDLHTEELMEMVDEVLGANKEKPAENAGQVLETVATKTEQAEEVAQAVNQVVQDEAPVATGQPAEDSIVETGDPRDDNSYLDGLQGLMDSGPIHTVTVPNTGGAQMNAAGAPAPQVMTTPPQRPANIQQNAAPQGPVVNQYEPTSLSFEEMTAAVHRIFHKCYNHMFAYCGQHAGGFSHGSKTYEMQIDLDDQETEVLVKMDCCDQNGRWCPNTPARYEINGQVKGRILGSKTKDGRPCYKLYFNANGQEVCRYMVACDPQGKNRDGSFKKTALAAQSGSRIMWIMEGNDAIKAANGGSGLRHKIVDGALEACGQ